MGSIQGCSSAAYGLLQGTRHAFDWEIHPDDVQFDGRTGEIYILGSLDAEEREAIKFVTDSLDLLHKAAEEAAERVRENPAAKSRAFRLVGTSS